VVIKPVAEQIVYSMYSNPVEVFSEYFGIEENHVQRA